MTITDEQVDTYFSLQKQLDDAIHEVVSLYNRICKEHGVDGWHDDNLEFVDIDDNEVEVKWHVTWRYGGYDGGTIYFPYPWLVQDNREELIRRDVEEKATRIRQKEAEQTQKAKQQRLEQFQKLKKEFGEA